MCRKLVFLISFIVVLSLVNSTMAAVIVWTNNGGNRDWCDYSNWSGESVPGSSDTATIDQVDAELQVHSPNEGPIAGIGCNVTVDSIEGPNPAFGNTQVMDINTDGTFHVKGDWSWRPGTGTGIININGSPTVNIDGGWRGTDDGVSIINISGNPNIIVGGGVRAADASGSFYFNMSGGFVSMDSEFVIGDNGGGEINMSGGIIDVNENMDMGGLRGSAPITINMTGGYIHIKQQFLLPGSASRAGNIWLNLDGGVIDCNEFLHGGSDQKPGTKDWKMDITEGTLIINGDVVDVIDGNVALGEITAYDGEGTVVVQLIDGNTVVTALPPDPNTATNPDPANHSVRVEPDVHLTWTAGINAAQHKVFLGTSFEDVNTMTDPCATQNLGNEEYDPGGLELSTTYYWRIDEVNDTTTWRGRIWQFTVRSAVIDPNLLIWYKFDEPNGYAAFDSSGRDYTGAVDGNQLLWDPNNGHYDGCRIFDEDGDAATVVDVPPAVTSTIDGQITISVWLKDADNGDDNWVFDTGAGGEAGPYHIQMALPTENGDLLWRAGDDSNDVLRWNLGGRDTGNIEGWHHWALVKDEGEGKMYIYFDSELVDSNTGVHNTLANIRNTTFKIGAGTWSNQDYVGKMDDFRIYDYALSEKEIIALYRGGDLMSAWAPKPHNGDSDIPHEVRLIWKPGDHAGSHDVYFGTNWDDVNDANNNWPVGTSVYKGNVGPNTYDVGLLDLGQVYYWRIDEVNDSNNDTWKGKIWKFTTAGYIIIDDFEDPAINQIGSAGNWLDGYLGGGTTGSILYVEGAGYPYRGTQSLYYTYDNDWGGTLGYYSEAETKSLKLTDWTAFGVKTLTLWFYGDPISDAGETEQMYVGLKDSNNAYAEARYPMADMNDIKVESWHTWDIPLSNFADANDVNLADVNTLYIGFGKRGSSTQGGSGDVTFDDIRLYPARCMPSLRKPAADLNNDCIVDFADVQILSDQWLERDVNLSPVQAPKDANLVGWWKLDEGAGDTAADSSGKGNDGTIQIIDVNVSWVSGHDGNALDFDGGRVRVPDAPILRPKHQISASAWVYCYEEENSARVVVKGPDNKETYDLEVDDKRVVFNLRDGNNPDLDSYPRYAAESNEAIATVDRDEWVHIAGTFDGDTVKCYIDGIAVATNNDANAIVILSQDTNDLAIGNRSDDTNREFVGMIDDVRVYDYGLSQEEVAYLATDGTGIFTVQSIANLSNDEALGSRAVNLKDFAVLANGWLEQKLWPE